MFNNKNEIDNYLKDMEKYLCSLQHFIRISTGITPLEFANQISNNFNHIKSITSSSDTIKLISLYESIINNYKEFLEHHTPNAITVAENIEAKHLESIENWKNYFYNLDLLQDYTLIFKHNNNTFNNSLICYRNSLLQLQTLFEENQEYYSLYPHNSLAQLCTNNTEFLAILKNGQWIYGGEIGHLILQRFISIDPNTPGWRKIFNALKPGGCFHDFFENNFFKYNPKVFKAEIIKLELYKQLYRQQGKPAIAWIGSANTLTRLLDPAIHLYKEERNGIYLNCGEEYLTPEFNRGWLLTLIEMGYEIKLVERQFPTIEQAILSNNPECFLIKLITEIRKMDQSNSKKTHSQYNGGDSPTATSLEMLLLMHMQYKTVIDLVEGTISLCRAQTTNPLICYFHDTHSTKKHYDLSYRRHSYADTTKKYKTLNQLIF